MSLNIKNEEAHRLARELSDLTGESMTAAVTAALDERLARLRRRRVGDIAERLMELGRKTAPLLQDLPLSTEIGEMFYDEQGLPE